jgi:hypothetical protein
MPNVYQIGRVGRVFAAKQSAFGTAPTFAATDAIRHLMVKLNYSPRNRVDSPERLAHPSQVTRFTRRTTGDWGIGGIFYPSGVLNTLPDHSDFLECGLGGTVTNTPAATTVASGATATGATLTSGTGMVVGQPILLNVTTGSPATGRVVRWLTSVAGAVVAWAPALPQAPGVGDTVKACTGYSLATALPNAMQIGHYLTSVSKEGDGCVVDQLKFMLDANDEIRWEASGPMRDRLTAAQSQPGSFTVVGSTPPSGLTATMRVGAAAYEFLKMGVTITNAMELDNFAAGTSKAQAFFRKGKRKVEVEINSMYSNDITLMTAAEGTTDQVVLAQCGQTEGSIVAMYCPLVELEPPDDPDNDETNEHAFKGVAKGNLGNDEFYLAVA